MLAEAQFLGANSMLLRLAPTVPAPTVMGGLIQEGETLCARSNPGNRPAVGAGARPLVPRLVATLEDNARAPSQRK